MKKNSAWILAAGLLAGAIACETSTSETQLPDQGVSNPLGAWSLQSFALGSGTVIPVPDPESYTLELTDEGRAHVRADCNVCNGAYTLSGSMLTFGNMGCTLAACPPASLERDYLRALGSTSTFEREGNVLTLVYADGVMEFQAR